MARKVLLGCMAAALALAGCTTAREKPVPSMPTSVASAPKPTPTPVPAVAKTKQRSTPRPTPRPTPTPAPARSDLPAMIGGGAKWVDPGRTLVVNRGTPAARQPVPIFRQAGVLAAVRANLAGSPAKPRAEFRRGLLTLTFDSGNNAEIAAAVRSAMNTPDTGAMGVYLNP
jgi:hypothetical protein